MFMSPEGKKMLTTASFVGLVIAGFAAHVFSLFQHQGDGYIKFVESKIDWVFWIFSAFQYVIFVGMTFVPSFIVSIFLVAIWFDLGEAWREFRQRRYWRKLR